MHLNIERRYVIYMLVTAVVFMLLLFAGVAPDVMNHEGQNWRNVAAAAAAEGGEAEQGGGEWTAATAYQNMCSSCHGVRPATASTSRRSSVTVAPRSASHPSWSVLAACSTTSSSTPSRTT